MYLIQMVRLFVAVRCIRLNLESRNKFPLLEMGGGLAHFGCFGWLRVSTIRRRKTSFLCSISLMGSGMVRWYVEERQLKDTTRSG